MAYTRRRKRYVRRRPLTRRRVRRRLSTRRYTMKGRRRTTKKRMLKRIIASAVHHSVLDRGKDREHYLVNQTFNGVMNWSPVQNSTNYGERSDGFILSMNSLINTFMGDGFLSTQFGVPLLRTTGGTGLWFDDVNVSGNKLTDTQTYIPDGVATMMGRFARCVVTGGVLTLRISNDTPETETINPSIKVAICGFPSGEFGDKIFPLTNGHYLYPAGTNRSVSGGGYDIASFSGLSTERNAIVRTLGGQGSSRTITTIKYPFRVAKYAPPGYWTNPVYFQSGPAHFDNPNFTNQPRILIQFLSDGVAMTHALKVEMSFKWRVTAFERITAISVP